MKQSILWEETIPLMKEGVHKSLVNKAYITTTECAKVFPLRENVFAAMRMTSFSETKVVILGQDPYINEHRSMGPEAHGLSFSVRKGIPIPPSLKNILLEVNNSIYGGKLVSTDSDLTRWAEQGVLLLNASLTVCAKKSNSHVKLGWHVLTDNIIETISLEKSDVVFMLWGAFAQKKKSLIDGSKHKILATSHPSPFSAHRGFLGSGVFTACNDYLASKGMSPITW